MTCHAAQVLETREPAFVITRPQDSSRQLHRHNTFKDTKEQNHPKGNLSNATKPVALFREFEASLQGLKGRKPKAKAKAKAMRESGICLRCKYYHQRVCGPTVTICKVSQMLIVRQKHPLPPISQGPEQCQDLFGAILTIGTT